MRCFPYQEGWQGRDYLQCPLHLLFCVITGNAFSVQGYHCCPAVLSFLYEIMLISAMKCKFSFQCSFFFDTKVKMCIVDNNVADVFEAAFVS